MDARGESPLCPMLWRRGSGRGADQHSASVSKTGRQARQPPGNAHTTETPERAGRGLG